MNSNEALAQADAFFLVTDRGSARDPRTGPSVRLALHETQIRYFDAWLSADLDLPILAFGRLFHRQCTGDRILAGLPMALCRDLEAVDKFVSAFDAEASDDPLERVKASAFLILMSDKAQENAVRAIVAALHEGGANARS
jgi:hypothetical protein